MSFESIRLQRDGGIARLTLTQAARGNPIDETFCREINEAALRLSEDSSVRCLLIDAEGKAFSYGGDVKIFMKELDDLPLHIKRWTTTLHSAIARLQRMDAPIVSAVHGVLAGGMCGFIAGSDYIVAGEKAQFVAAYAGIGFNCDAGSSVMFARRMGAHRARRFLLMNEVLDAKAALKVGLVDETAAADALNARAEEVAAKLAAGPTKAYGRIRRLMLSVTDQPLETQLEREAQALASTAASEDAREGLAAFAEGRAPQFEGR